MLIPDAYAFVSLYRTSIFGRKRCLCSPVGSILFRHVASRDHGREQHVDRGSGPGPRQAVQAVEQLGNGGNALLASQGRDPDAGQQRPSSIGMALFELVIGLLIAGALLSIWSGKLGIPYPVALAIAGAAAAFVPGTPEATLDPQLALALFVSPVLLDAAFDASPRDLRDNWISIATLVVIMVGLTVASVAIVAHALVPGMPWAATIALGAIVAPPDASAATSVLRQLRLPHRLLVILEGESLLNDAAALLTYRIAVGAAMGGSGLGWSAAPTLLLTVGGGALLGWALGRLIRFVPLHQSELPVDVLLQFLATFAVWIVADLLEVSAIITVVAYGMTLARHAPAVMGARRRLASYAVWEVAVFVLNVLAFILVGLQFRAIAGRLDGALGSFCGVAVAVLAAVILVRVAWAMGYNVFVRRRFERFGRAGGGRPVRPTVGGGILVSWCGMRGIVTLATALGLPEGFPQRDLIVFCAFSITLGTLVLQGLTLRPLIACLTLPEDTSVDDEIRAARGETARAALQALDSSSEAATVLRREYEAREAGGAEAELSSGSVADLQGRAVAAQRGKLLDLRRDGTIGDDAFHKIQEELDIIELTADPMIRTLDVPA